MKGVSEVNVMPLWAVRLCMHGADKPGISAQTIELICTENQEMKMPCVICILFPCWENCLHCCVLTSFWTVFQLYITVCQLILEEHSNKNRSRVYLYRCGETHERDMVLKGSLSGQTGISTTWTLYNFNAWVDMLRQKWVQTSQGHNLLTQSCVPPAIHHHGIQSQIRPFGWLSTSYLHNIPWIPPNDLVLWHHYYI